MKVYIQQAEAGGYTCPTDSGRKNTYPIGGHRWGQVPNKQRQEGIHTYQAEVDRDSYLTC